MPFAFAFRSIPFGKASLSKIIIGSNAFALPNRSVVVTSFAVIEIEASVPVTFIPSPQSAPESPDGSPEFPPTSLKKEVALNRGLKRVD